MNPSFHRQLLRIRRTIRTGRLLAAMAAVAGLAGCLWLAFGIADGFAAFETDARSGITIVLLAITGLALLAACYRAFRVGIERAASEADTAAGDPRDPAQTALSLKIPSDASPFAALLANRTMESAAAGLAVIPGKRVFPWKRLRSASVVLAIALLAMGVAWIAAPAAFSTISQRLLHPASDIPPYSPLVFTVTPENAAAVYGGELALTVTITGGQPEHAVECLVRRTGKNDILRLPAFKESPSRFTRKIDGLTEPLEIAFASGKARSRWQPVEILLEPKILSGMVHLTPPAYTGLPGSSFALDTNEIAAVEGTEIRLELSSNRPLASGTLVFTPAGNPADPAAITETIEARIDSPKAATFLWTAGRAGRISASVTDLRGTPAPQPLELALRALPDMPPRVDLTSPPRQMMATPKSVIPVRGTAEDDFSLSRLQFVRTLSGFRDRVRVVAPAIQGKGYEFSEKLDLEELGLEAGQTIELMLEASDHNPSLLGRGSSEISRVRIISEDEYAAHIRAKTTISQFSARFRAAREAMDRARESLEKLRAARDEADPAKEAQALQKAKDAQRDAAELMEKLAADFPAFELEERLKELAGKQAAEFRRNLAELDDAEPDDLEGMLQRLQQNRAEEERLEQDVELVREAGQLLEMAAKFRQIYENQKSMAKRFGTIVEEIRRGENQNRRLLPSLAETQEKNRKALDDFKEQLARRLEAPGAARPELQPLRDSAADFLRKLAEAAPETLMDAAAAHGKEGRSNDAFANAEMARALLERLMSEPEPFPEAAMGKAPQFDVPNPDVNATVAEMLEALLGQNPGQQGEGPQPGGQGLGMGGFGADGAPMSGIPRDMPVVGPERMQFEAQAGLSDQGNGNGRTGAVAPLPENAENSTLVPTIERQGDSSMLSPESIPEPYRDAVKRYFTP